MASGGASALHPALAYHVVNTLGWPSLRPFQEQASGPLSAGEHGLLLAPTAGGKTEAAIFPLLSRMLYEDWRGLSVLYLCPIKALLNNLEPRLVRYAEMIGRRAALWHGDVAPGARRRIVREPPDLLLTTPESIEAMLVSSRGAARAMLATARAVVVDEIHAFAGDDRGSHLLAVLHRLERRAERPLQRVGLSATVGNTEDLLDWLTADAPGPRRLIRGESPPETGSAGTVPRADVQVDYVGTLDNAALVISRLYQGEKRLVFCDSRARVERLALALRQLEVRTYVSHSSLSRDERHQAERAFAEDRDCVIVATSTLELGIDVGDLDRVLQVDAPPSVASMLQRMGRTGRRAGAPSNLLMLTTSDDALLRAAGLVELWAAGFVESVEGPGRPLHVLAQQIMALALERGGIGAADWPGELLGQRAFATLRADDPERIVDHMLDTGILHSDQGVLWFGAEGEAAFGRRHFLEILGVLTSPPQFQVLHGRQDLGTVDQTALFYGQADPTDDLPPALLLGGRAWQIVHIAWSRRRLYVEPAQRRGRSLWVGEGRPLHFEHCQAIRRVLAGEAEVPGLSRRAVERLDELRLDHPWLESDESTVLVNEGDAVAWWTFAGLRANQSLVPALRAACREVLGTEPAIRAENLFVRLQTSATPGELKPVVASVLRSAPESLRPEVSAKAIDGLKFSACLPNEMAREMLAERAADPSAAATLARVGLRAIGSE